MYLLANGKLTLVYRNQTGLVSEDENIVNSNLNNSSRVVIPVAETPFKDLNGEYAISYIYEALDTYAGMNYYSENDDFDKFKKVLTNNQK